MSAADERPPIRGQNGARHRLHRAAEERSRVRAHELARGSRSLVARRFVSPSSATLRVSVMLRARERRRGPDHRQGVEACHGGLIPVSCWRYGAGLARRPSEAPDPAPPACNRGADGAAAADCPGLPLHTGAAGGTSSRFTRPRAARPCLGRGGTRPAGGPRPHLPSPAPGPPPGAASHQPRQRPRPPAPPAMDASARHAA
jgi:hypothetical protein